MRGNIAMPPLHASPCIVSARQVSVLGVRLAAGAIAISPLHPTGGASVCFVGFCGHCSNLAQMAGDVLGIVVSAPRGSWREQVGRCRVKPAEMVSIGGASS